METRIKFISEILECPCNKIHIVVTVYNVRCWYGVNKKKKIQIYLFTLIPDVGSTVFIESQVKIKNIYIILSFITFISYSNKKNIYSIHISGIQ